ncbi:MAG TPA: AAA family ATPase [Burkholderiales bacterium]|nr:AAA family ATPase [Burkholderiales bacterium]
MSNEHWLIEELEQHLKEKKEAKFSAEQKKVIEYFTNNYAKEKIQNLSLEKYTNIFDKNKPSETEYLCHFLEITSSVFGSSRPGNATQFGIYKRKDQKQGEYYFPNNSDNKPADTYFNDKIRPILESLCKEINGNLEDSLVKIFNNDEDSPIQAKQCLLKFVYLNNMDKLINIYRKETLQAIGTALGLDQERIKSDSILELNYAISKEIIRELKLDEDESRNVKLFNIGERLWQMFGATFPITAKNTILYGAPGTGKTYSTIKSIEDEIVSAGGNIDKQFCLVQFHPSYSYEDFIDGIKPTKVGSGAVNLELVNGKFKEMCIRAFKELVEANKINQEAKKYYFVADEINRAELSRVFGELLLCLEEDKRLRFEDGKLIGTKVQTQNSALWEPKHAVVIVNKDNGDMITFDEKEGKWISIKDNSSVNNNPTDYNKEQHTMYFGVPENLYFIGTMNDIDRSIDSFDMALRRRFFWKKCECDYNVITNHYQNDKLEQNNIADFIRQCENLNKHISSASDNGLNLGSSYELGHSYFMSSDKKLTAASKNEMWENHIQPLIREYLRAYTEIEIKDKLKIAKAKFLSDTEQEDINNDN